MQSRSRSIAILVVAALGAFFAPLLGTQSAAAADFHIWVSPDRGAVGTNVTIYGVGDTEPDGATRTVVWRCDWFPPGPPDIVIGQVTIRNGAWQIDSTVPADCVPQYTEQGEPQVVATVYGNAPFTVFTLTSAPADCPEVRFIGAHGINEGAAGGGDGTVPAKMAYYWGETVQAVWNEFAEEVNATTTRARPVAGDYERTTVDTPLQIRALQPAADAAGAALETQVIQQFVQCGTRTQIVLAGFSLGAWAVDKALRNLQGTPAGQAALTVVAAAGVMGDPAFPPHFCDISPCRMGLATKVGHGYRTDAAYLDNGLPNRFMSLCLSYSETNRDPVCGVRKVRLDFNPLDPATATRIQTHNDYDASGGGATQIADFLASQLQ